MMIAETRRLIDRLPDQVSGSTGKTHGWAELRIADENDLPVEAGTVGHILLRSRVTTICMYRFSGSGTLNSPMPGLPKRPWLSVNDRGPEA